MLRAMSESCVRASRFLPSIAVCTALALSGCAEPRPATQVTVYVDAQSMVRAETRVLEVIVRAGTPGNLGETPDSPYRFEAPIDWPRDFTFIPLGGDVTRTFEIDAIAYDANRRMITIARLRGGFTEHAARTLRLTLEDRCRGIICPTDYTCRSGGCVQLVDPDPDAGPDDLDAGVPTDAPPLPCTTDEACDDGVFCNGTERCEAGRCAAGDIVVCDDGIRCTQDVCTGDGCTYLPDHAMCSVDPSGRCDPDTGCQYATCDTATTCTPEACERVSCEGTICRRYSVCGEAESCCNGECVARGCDDGNACTTDYCAESSTGARGCQHEARTGACSDGNACTTGDRCTGTACTPGTPGGCEDDGNPCTAELCDPVGGCSSVPLDMPYDDGDFCTVGERCSAGVLIPGTPNPCSDGVACTDDTCALGACANTPNDRRCTGTFARCDATNGCQTGSTCDGSTCVPADSCETASCSGTTCVRAPVTCTDDGNPCTDTVCVPGTGCTHVPNSAGCSDGNPCTTGDRCQAGACVAGTAITCNDGNPCTTDVCSGGSCTSTPVADGGTCNDGNACSLGDRCVAGTCTGTSTNTCNDNNPCTSDACSASTGCVNTPSPAGTSCGLVFECMREVCDGAGACVAEGACMPGQLCCDGFCRHPMFCDPIE